MHIACQERGWEHYTNDEVTGLVREGLAKNRIEYGFQACPCEPALMLDAPGSASFASREEMEKKT